MTTLSFAVTTQVYTGKGIKAQSYFAYLLLNFFLCASVPLPLCAYLSSYCLSIIGRDFSGRESYPPDPFTLSAKNC